MTVMKAVADHFRASPKQNNVDQYGILSPLLATGEYITTSMEMVSILSSSKVTSVISGEQRPFNKNVDKGLAAYRDYVKHLSPTEQNNEKKKLFSTITAALESINANVGQIEDNFQLLFGNLNNGTPETTMRASSLVIVGYLEKADSYASWLGNLVEHLTAEDHDSLPPFRSKELLTKASDAANFSTLNVTKWNYKNAGILTEVKDMQKRGSDLAIQSPDGSWIDDYGHDSQYSPAEQSLITSSFRSPIMMLLTWSHIRRQDKIELLSNRHDWLKSKILLERAKLQGMDPNSPDYKRLQKACDRYADKMSQFEQKIERLRAE